MIIRRKVFVVSLAAFTVSAFLLTGCKKEEERGVSRIPGMASATPVVENSALMATNSAPDSDAIPKHAAPPLSELGAGAAAGNADPHAGGAVDANMVVQAGETKVMAGGNILQVAGLAFTVSEDWTNVKPENPVRVAEYKLEGSGGPAEMAVFYFGKNQGGGMEDNIRRWAGQFADASTTSPGAQVARIEKDSLRIALVKTEGTYNPGSMGPMMPKQPAQENYALFGLVVEGGPEGRVFVKVTGPKSTLSEQDEALEKMAQSVRVSDYK